MIHELRTYTCPPLQRTAVVQLVEKVMPIFERHGIKIVGAWTTMVGRTNSFVYLVEYESLADREKKWGSFVQDQELLSTVQAAGDITISEDNTLLQPTSYSRLR